MKKHTVLVVDDDESIQRALKDTLSSWGYRVAIASSGAEAMTLVDRQTFDAALLDVRMPGMDGLELLRAIRRQDPSLEVVMMTGYPIVSTAVAAMKEGAGDYLTKPLILEELRDLMNRAMERVLSRQGTASRQRRFEDQPVFRELVGTSAGIERVKAVVARVAPTDSAVLLEGESGTGKELVAAAIHRLSRRGKGPFLAVNCAAIPRELLESELFGHVRGAFSGAVADALGLFRSAHGGTVFLDEIAELPPSLQAKLLRILEDKEVRPVGSTKSYTVDARIITATNRPLDEAIREGSLRRDLFYRLNVVRIAMPTLRDRKADLPALLRHFVWRFNQRFRRKVREITPEAMAALAAYDFPGNVRELEHLLERAYALGADREITLADLPPLRANPSGAAPPQDVPTLAQTERDLILRALQRYDNNKQRAARALGVSRRTIYRRLRQYGLP